MADPLARVKPDLKGEKKDRRRVRRTLSTEQLVKLIDTTLTAPPYTWPNRGGRESITGEDRALLYHVASATGLRASELRALTPAAFRLDDSPPSIVAEAAYAKGGRKDTLPIGRDLAAILRPWLAGKAQSVFVFNMPAS